MILQREEQTPSHPFLAFHFIPAHFTESSSNRRFSQDVFLLSHRHRLITYSDREAIHSKGRRALL